MVFLQSVGRRRRTVIIGGLVILGVAAVGAWFLIAPSSKAKVSASAANPPVPVTAAIAAQQDVPDIVNALGTVQSIDNVALQARVSGPIMKIEFKPGQDVKQGQEMFLIDPRPYQAALDEAKAQLAHDEGILAEAQVDLTRYQTLKRQSSIAGQTAEDQVYVVQQDKGTVETDQANVETAQLNLEFCHIVAPVSGRAGALLVDLGNLVGPGQTSGSSNSSSSGSSTTSSSTSSQTTAGAMVTIAQITPIYVSFNVPQNMLDEIKHNQAATPLDVDAYSQAGKLLEKGKLTLIDNLVSTSTGTVLMQATFANTDETLWPGEYVRVNLITAIRKNAVTVPVQTVMAGPNGSYVYVIGPDKKVTRVAVTVAARQNSIAVISKGLASGQQIVTDGQYGLDNGVEVVVRQSASEQQATAASKTE